MHYAVTIVDPSDAQAQITLHVSGADAMNRAELCAAVDASPEYVKGYVITEVRPLARTAEEAAEEAADLRRHPHQFAGDDDAVENAIEAESGR